MTGLYDLFKLCLLSCCSLFGKGGLIAAMREGDDLGEDLQSS